jgi:uncharacterized glyoxalase superfamily protein PhnB
VSTPEFCAITPVLRVDDLVASLEHYQTVLGFQRVWQWSTDRGFDEVVRPTFACVRRGECAIFLCEKGQGNPGTWICLQVKSGEDLARIHQEYQASGANIVDAPRDSSWGMREMLVRDIDGNTFRIGVQLCD